MRKVSIVDPICILPFGHNMGSLSEFSKVYQTNGDNVNLFVSSDYDGWEPNNTNIKKTLTHNHGFLGKAMTAGTIDLYLNELEEILFNSDVVFFPGVDYVTLSLLSKLLNKLDAAPVLRLRLIGVMENEQYEFNTFSKVGINQEFISLLKEIDTVSKSKHFDVKFFAETIKYCKFLEGCLNTVVYPSPYPLFNYIEQYQGCKTTDRLTFGFLGAPREDKGYFDILEIINSITPEVREISNFLIQPRKASDIRNYNSDYESALLSLGCVQFTNPIMTDQEMEDSYLACDVLCLPYHPNVYSLRGSAILFEAIKFNKPVIANIGLGFCDEISQFNLGCLVQLGEFGNKMSSMLSNLTKLNPSEYLVFNKTSIENLTK